MSAHNCTVARARLPSWPVTALLALMPLWWLLGVIDVVIVPLAIAMTALLVRSRPVRVPRGFGVWAMFLVLMLCSVVELSRGRELLTFGYRAAIYLASTVVLVYVHNARQSLPTRRVLRLLAGYWAATIAGGLLGVVAPTATWRTPAYHVVSRISPGLLSNDLVRVMVVRPLAQYSPNGYFKVPPRPAAPFLFTNEWGNTYSLLLPLVLVLIAASAPRSSLRRWLLVLVPISAVPALLTLNRGMMIGLAIVAVYCGARLALRRRFGPIAALGVVVPLVVVAWFASPLHGALASRSGVSTTTRASLYRQALHAAASSPVFGSGVPVSSTNAADPPIGTQGQFWMVLVSHGMFAAACFVAFFVTVFVLSLRRTDAVGLACNAVVLTATVELLYYGDVPYGLPVMMCVAALAVRPGPGLRPQGSVPPRQRLAAPAPRRVPARR